MVVFEPHRSCPYPPVELHKSLFLLHKTQPCAPQASPYPSNRHKQFCKNINQ